jgi:hypothetical protein
MNSDVVGMDKAAGFGIAFDQDPFDSGGCFDIASHPFFPLLGIFQIGIGFEQRLFHKRSIP